MPPNQFHDKPFDEETLTKLQLFELYTKEWLPVFLAPKDPYWKQIHLFDFFAGPGTDSTGQPGSPLRLLSQISEYRNQPGWEKVRIFVHLFDKNARKIKKLRAAISDRKLEIPGIKLDVRPLAFEKAFKEMAPLLQSRNAAKLTFVDQCGVAQVTDEVFRKLTAFPTCDLIFFLSTSTLHRFRSHPAIKIKIVRPNDYYHVHKTVFKYYHDLLPSESLYYLAPFSIKKGSNIYGIIFGSSHLLGMDKFMQVAWSLDPLNGEANFDINRENLQTDELILPLDVCRPSKITAFERELDQSLRDGRLKNELDIIRICFKHCVKRQHAKPILDRLKKGKVIKVSFNVPDISRIKSPRPIEMMS